MREFQDKKWERIGIEETDINFIPDHVIYVKGCGNNLSLFGEGGCAYIITDGKDDVIKAASKGLLSTTSPRAEMLSILSALRLVPSDSLVVVVTGSEYCINALTERTTRFSQGYANQDILLMYEIEKTRIADISFKWIGKHDTNYHYSVVNAMAREKLEEVRQLYRLPTTTRKSRFNKFIINRANKMSEWLTTPESKNYHDTEVF